MTFSELLNLDQVPTQSNPLHRPGVPDKVHKGGESHPAVKQHTTVDATIPSKQKSMSSRHHDTTNPRQQDSRAFTTVKRLRQAVKRIGKEAATHRFTPQEKADLAQIIYQQGRKGIKTSENEIVRIAVNWLIAEHRARDKQSVLAQTLKALRD